MHLFSNSVFASSSYVYNTVQLINVLMLPCNKTINHIFAMAIISIKIDCFKSFLIQRPKP